MNTIVQHVYQFKRGTAWRWTELNPILRQGEPGFEYDTGKLKIGDGFTPWAALHYVTDDDGNDTEIVTVLTYAELPIEGDGLKLYRVIEDQGLYQWRVDTNSYESLGSSIDLEDIKKYIDQQIEAANLAQYATKEQVTTITRDLWKHIDNIESQTTQGILEAKTLAQSANARIEGFLKGTAEANSAIDTLIEIQQYINSDTEAFAALNQKVSNIESGAVSVPRAIDADTLDGKHAQAFALADHTHDTHSGVGQATSDQGDEIFNYYGQREEIIDEEGNSYIVGNIATGGYAHAEGNGTTAQGVGTHAEGIETSATNKYAHAEGRQTIASGESSHAEGSKTQATGNRSHAEGLYTIAEGIASHAEGSGWMNPDSGDIVYTIAVGNHSHAEGYITSAAGSRAHAEGYGSVAAGEASHAQGYKTYAIGKYSDASGYSDKELSKFNLDSNSPLTEIEQAWIGANKDNAFVAALNNGSHSEGRNSLSSGKAAHSEGRGSYAKGDYSHAEGNRGNAYQIGCHAEGEYTQAGKLPEDVVEGDANTGKYSHAEGSNTKALGNHSHAGGRKSEAHGENSFAHGQTVTAKETNQFVIGKYNKNNVDALFMVGNGTNTSQKKNAFEVLSDGRATIGKNPINEMDVVNKGYVDTQIAKSALPPLNVTADENNMASHTLTEIFDYMRQGGRVYFNGWELSNYDDDTIGFSYAFFNYIEEEGSYGTYVIYDDGRVVDAYYPRTFGWDAENVRFDTQDDISFSGVTYFHGPIELGGEQEIKVPITFQQDAPVAFHGYTDFHSPAFYSSQVTFKDKVYFQENTKFINPTTFDGQVFMNNVQVDLDASFNGPVCFNDTVDFTASAQFAEHAKFNSATFSGALDIHENNLFISDNEADKPITQYLGEKLTGVEDSIRGDLNGYVMYHDILNNYNEYGKAEPIYEDDLVTGFAIPDGSIAMRDSGYANPDDLAYVKVKGLKSAAFKETSEIVQEVLNALPTWEGGSY